MEKENKNKNSCDTILYMRISQYDKNMCAEMVKYYGMPNISTFIRELIRKQIELFNERKEK